MGRGSGRVPTAPTVPVQRVEEVVGVRAAAGLWGLRLRGLCVGRPRLGVVLSGGARLPGELRLPCRGNGASGPAARLGDAHHGHGHGHGEPAPTAPGPACARTRVCSELPRATCAHRYTHNQNTHVHGTPGHAHAAHAVLRDTRLSSRRNRGSCRPSVRSVRWCTALRPVCGCPDQDGWAARGVVQGHAPCSAGGRVAPAVQGEASTSGSHLKRARTQQTSEGASGPSARPHARPDPSSLAGQRRNLAPTSVLRTRGSHQTSTGCPAARPGWKTVFWGSAPACSHSPRGEPPGRACLWAAPPPPGSLGTSPGTSPGCHTRPGHTCRGGRVPVRKAVTRCTGRPASTSKEPRARPSAARAQDGRCASGRSVHTGVRTAGPPGSSARLREDAASKTPTEGRPQARQCAG